MKIRHAMPVLVTSHCGSFLHYKPPELLLKAQGPSSCEQRDRQGLDGEADGTGGPSGSDIKYL